MLAVAFKEWAAVCGALAAGRQALILRKGGIAEGNGGFRPEHAEFLLYPTFFHEHRAGVKPGALPLLAAAEAERPAAGTVRLAHLARVAAVARVGRLETALALDPLHVWTPAVVEQRFHYRGPGLFVLAVRVLALPRPVEVPERPEYAGCKTWVPLADPIDPAGATPVLPDDEFAKQLAALEALARG